MTEHRLYRLAYSGALERWDTERKRWEASKSEYSHKREQKAWQEVEIIEKKLAKLEKETA